MAYGYEEPEDRPGMGKLRKYRTKKTLAGELKNSAGVEWMFRKDDEKFQEMADEWHEALISRGFRQRNSLRLYKAPGVKVKLSGTTINNKHHGSREGFQVRMMVWTKGVFTRVDSVHVDGDVALFLDALMDNTLLPLCVSMEFAKPVVERWLRDDRHVQI